MKEKEPEGRENIPIQMFERQGGTGAAPDTGATPVAAAQATTGTSSAIWCHPREELLCWGLLPAPGQSNSLHPQSQGGKAGQCSQHWQVQNFGGMGLSWSFPSPSAALPKMLSMLQALISQQTWTQNYN